METTAKVESPQSNPIKQNTVLIIKLVIGLAVSLLIATAQPPQGLTVAAMRFLGIFFCIVYMLILRVIPDTAVALIMCAACVVFNVTKQTVAFSQFSGDTYFMILGAMGIGAAVAKSGLLKRISWKIMTLFPGTYKGQVLAFLTTGTLVAPFIPSTTAKMMIAAPFGRAVAENLGLNKESQGAAGIFSTIWIAFGNAAPLFLSASVWCYTLKGLLPQDIAAAFTWGRWFVVAAPWGIVTLLLTYFVYTKIFKDDSTVQLPKGFAKEQSAALGKMTIPEIITSLILFICILLWVTERTTGIAASMVAMIAFGILFALKVIGKDEIKNSIAWETLIFIAAILSIATMFGQLGIDKWLSTLIGPYVAPFTKNPFIFITAISIFIYLVRFVIISTMTCFTVFSMILMPFAVNAGYNPFIVPFTILAAMQVWNVLYQNAIFIGVLAASGPMCEHKNTVKGSIAYMIISLIGLLVSVPFWKLMGLL
jgi:Di- and tricarboxylate transporters